MEQPYKKDGRRRVFYRCQSCTWKSSSLPPKPHKTPCAECGGQVVEVAYKKDGKARVFFRCTACEWKGPTPAPTKSTYACIADEAHGPMFEYAGTSKQGKPYRFWQCHVCRDQANDKDAGKTWTPVAAPACPSCTKPMRLMSGKNGEFWGCSGYPTCKTTAPYEGAETKPRPSRGSATKTRKK